MWLPTPIYKHLPQFWLLLGLMFFTLGLYIGFEFDLIYAYLCLGAACIARSVWVFFIRQSHQDSDAQPNAESPAHDTASPGHS